MSVTFEDIWEYRMPPAEELRQLPEIDAVVPGDRQVLVPHPGDPRLRPSVDAPPASLERLADTPWVDSVVAEWPCRSAVELPGIRSLFNIHAFQVTRQLLARLPDLQQLTAHDVLPEDLRGLDDLRDLEIGWHSYDIPAGYPRDELLLHPHLLEPFATVTEGAPVLGRMKSLERLHVRDFRYREPADPIAELANLRWLRLRGWRNLRVLGRLTGLERLELNEFAMANLRAFRGLTRLHTLALGGRMDSLAGIESMGALEEVRLHGRAVRDLVPLVELPRLHSLDLVFPDAVSDFEAIGRLRGLRRLKLLLGDDTDVGVLPSIAFLGSLEALEEIDLRNVDIADRRLDPLFELPRLRRLALTGRAGPNVEELRRRRPELEIRTHLTGEPEGRVYVGRVHYDPPVGGLERWSIFQSLADLLGTDTNHDAATRVRGELRRRDGALLKRLEFDSEAGAVGIYATTEADIRSVAETIRDLIALVP